MYSVYTLSLIRINPITTQWKPQPNPQSKRRESQITETYKNKKKRIQTGYASLISHTN
ncbi:hypothetical protein [Xanthomarina sp.]|uniref:hypothetical protein n=1 Tax=Xanthomarina sp. TaxID=1931211 RepID=UPI00257E657F|nr:hypothetical protein [Xanthomarina sp.]